RNYSSGWQYGRCAFAFPHSTRLFSRGRRYEPLPPTPEDTAIEGAHIGKCNEDMVQFLTKWMPGDKYCDYPAHGGNKSDTNTQKRRKVERESVSHQGGKWQNEGECGHQGAMRERSEKLALRKGNIFFHIEDRNDHLERRRDELAKRHREQTKEGRHAQY